MIAFIVRVLISIPLIAILIEAFAIGLGALRNLQSRGEQWAAVLGIGVGLVVVALLILVWKPRLIVGSKRSTQESVPRPDQSASQAAFAAQVDYGTVSNLIVRRDGLDNAIRGYEFNWTRTDIDGQRRTEQVKMRGKRIVGSLANGDRVELFGEWEEGQLATPERLFNHTQKCAVVGL